MACQNKMMRQADEILFSARWKRKLDSRTFIPLFCGVGPTLWRALSGSPIWSSLVAAAFTTATFLGLEVAFFRWRKFVLLSDRLRFTSYGWSKDVKYRNMRAISMHNLGANPPQLSIKLLHPRYTTVSEIYLPPEFCAEILRILARQAPQAEMNELALQFLGEKVAAI